MDKLDPILEIRGLKKIFKGDLFQKKQIAVNGISCRFLRHQCTGLLGHNGAGKTTTIRLILGLLRPTAGEILFNGKPMTGKDRRQFGYMPEINKIPDALTPEELLKYHLRFYGVSHNKNNHNEKIKQALTQVGLWKARNKKIKALSKGMGRRLAWAMATIHNPDFVILDEPFSGLDPVARQDLLNWIKEFKCSGKSLLLCTHELWTVQALCDQVHIFRKGRLAYSTLDPAEEKTALGITHSNYNLIISGTNAESLTALKSSHSLPDWQSIKQDGYVVRLNFVQYEDALKWLEQSIQQGFVILKFSDELSLDDTYLKRIFEGGQIQ